MRNLNVRNVIWKWVQQWYKYKVIKKVCLWKTAFTEFWGSILILLHTKYITKFVMQSVPYWKTNSDCRSKRNVETKEMNYWKPVDTKENTSLYLSLRKNNFQTLLWSNKGYFTILKLLSKTSEDCKKHEMNYVISKGKWNNIM